MIRVPPTILAIDPGAKGALIWGDRLDAFSTQNMPGTYEDLVKLFRQLEPQVDTVFLEYISGFISVKIKNLNGEEKEGGVSSKAMFTFGRNYGALELACLYAGFDLTYVTPQVWQKKIGMSGIKKQLMTQNQWKNELKEKAQELFPETKVTLANADALLIYYAAHQNLL